jgi:hypothetical protein
LIVEIDNEFDIVNPNPDPDLYERSLQNSQFGNNLNFCGKTSNVKFSSDYTLGIR